MASNGEVPAALINLGNIAYVKGDNQAAMDYFMRALKKSSNNSIALQGIAMAGYELGDTNAVQTALAQLKTDGSRGGAASGQPGCGERRQEPRRLR